MNKKICITAGILFIIGGGIWLLVSILNDISFLSCILPVVICIDGVTFIINNNPKNNIINGFIILAISIIGLTGICSDMDIYKGFGIFQALILFIGSILIIFDYFKNKNNNK